MSSRMSDKKRNSSALSLGFFDNIPKKKRRQTLIHSGEKRSALFQLYGNVDYMFSKNSIIEEQTMERDCSFGFLLEVTRKELKKINRNTIKKHNKSAELPSHLREVVESKGGRNIKLVLTKVMYNTDLNKQNSRFQIPVKKIVCPDFLTKEEKDSLKQIHGQNKIKKKKGSGMDVKIIIEPSLEEHSLKLREWPMKKNNNYVLVSGWNSAIKNVKESRAIKDDDVVQLWSFRCGDELWFLLHKVKN